MSANDDGGSAFPFTYYDMDSSGETVPRYQEGGMSLRDWFASHATEDDLGQYLPATVGHAQDLKAVDGIERTREWAKYQYADAMLEARK